MPIPPRRAPFPSGTTTAAGGDFQLLQDLGSDRAVALVLGLLGPVLEERQVVLGRVLRAGELGLVEIGCP